MVKSVGIIFIAALVSISALFLQMRANKATRLENELKAKNEVLAKLQDQDKKLLAELHAQPTPAPLAAAPAPSSALRAQLEKDLAAAELELATAQRQRAGLQDQIDQLAAKKGDAGDPSVSGEMQNDQTRLQQVERDLKDLEQFKKDRQSSNKVDAKTYHDQMKADEARIGSQVKLEKERVKAIEKQISDAGKLRTDPFRNEKVTGLQTSLQNEKAVLFTLEQSLTQLHEKEHSDSTLNADGQARASEDEQQSKESLQAEQRKLKSDLQNLKSRTELSKRVTNDIGAQITKLHAQEHDADVRLHAITQTVTRLKAETAAPK